MIAHLVSAQDSADHLLDVQMYPGGRRVLHPRWYVAVRAGSMRSRAAPALNVWDTAVGCYQLLENLFAVQFVTGLRSISIAHD